MGQETWALYYYETWAKQWFRQPCAHVFYLMISEKRLKREISIPMPALDSRQISPDSIPGFEEGERKESERKEYQQETVRTKNRKES